MPTFFTKWSCLTLSLWHWYNVRVIRYVGSAVDPVVLLHTFREKKHEFLPAQPTYILTETTTFLVWALNLIVQFCRGENVFAAKAERGGEDKLENFFIARRRAPRIFLSPVANFVTWSAGLANSTTRYIKHLCKKALLCSNVPLWSPHVPVLFVFLDQLHPGSVRRAQRVLGLRED